MGLTPHNAYTRLRPWSTTLSSWEIPYFDLADKVTQIPFNIRVIGGRPDYLIRSLEDLQERLKPKPYRWLKEDQVYPLIDFDFFGPRRWLELARRVTLFRNSFPHRASAETATDPIKSPAREETPHKQSPKPACAKVGRYAKRRHQTKPIHTLSQLTNPIWDRKKGKVKTSHR